VRFLLTNDDGIYAPGLAALYEELSQLATCVIVAPEVEQSAVGHAITLFRPLTVRKARRNGRFLGYAVSGTPADCVKLGIREICTSPPDLVVSGINLGANVGTNVIYSGTVSAATEAAILGVPALAISLDARREADFSAAARVAREVADWMAKVKPEGLLALNVNIPNLPLTAIKGILTTRQGKTRLIENFDKRTDPRDNTYYWLAGEIICPADEETDTDAAALKNGWVSVTPIHYDLTCHDFFDRLPGITKLSFSPSRD
jgi:5'-nucleotidase